MGRVPAGGGRRRVALKRGPHHPWSRRSVSSPDPGKLDASASVAQWKSRSVLRIWPGVRIPPGALFASANKRPCEILGLRARFC